ncbi:hypothetical protein DC498_18670 [Terrimonas sp.]|uniref:hypothetical protein n=1 Tax=Terrimonas sp. TaxID=1914338 RepID=UPI000D505EAE|nr:hypothetical protein [Terrimonas sp.]PVD50620.1 hypothetical protein DC498_18670 [Terrimonas sp.]
MRRIFTLILTLMFLCACNKLAVEPDIKSVVTSDTVLVDLTILSTVTPSNIIQGQNIISNVRCFGSNLCYNFAKFEVLETSPRQFEIKAKSTYPTGRDIGCFDAIYYKDTTFEINTPASGQYVLKFLNNNQIFKTDIVQVD